MKQCKQCDGREAGAQVRGYMSAGGRKRRELRAARSSSGALLRSAIYIYIYIF